MAQLPPPVTTSRPPTAPHVEGVALALGAYVIWGMFPLVFKTVAHLPPFEVLAHRSAWALVVAFVLMALMGRREIFSRAFYAPKTLAVMTLSGVAVAVNWGAFILAVTSGHVLQSSLGYYMSPLVSVLLGVVILRERMSLAQGVAVALVAGGVLNLLLAFGEPPWIALILAVSWAVYGLVRKMAPVGSMSGLYLETLMLLPLALGYLIWLKAGGAFAFGGNWADSLLLAGSGLVTVLPLLLFARATRMLKLSSIGLLMYLVPTLQFSLAVFVFGEDFTRPHLVSFALIWTALALYGLDGARRRRVRA